MKKDIFKLVIGILLVLLVATLIWKIAGLGNEEVKAERVSQAAVQAKEKKPDKNEKGGCECPAPRKTPPAWRYYA